MKTLSLNNLKPAKGSVKTPKRVGRGQGSGLGGTSTKGHKGAQSRTGYKFKPYFEGGQMPISRRIPKFGFKPYNKVVYHIVNLETIAELAKSGIVDITPELLKQKGIIRNLNQPVKILGRGELSTTVTVKANKFSKSAKQAIESSNGKALEI